MESESPQFALPDSGRADAVLKRRHPIPRIGSSLQLTRAADYGIRAMVYLAQLPENQRATLCELAAATGAPESFLSKVMQCLCHVELVVSCRGQVGGFTLLPAGRHASMAKVIEAIDGLPLLNLCLSQGASCNRKNLCSAHPVWVEAQEAMMAVLRAHSIADLAARTIVTPNPLVQL